MPLYELFALAKPALSRTQQFEILRAAANSIYAGGGVVAHIQSLGERETAYSIRPPGQKYDEAFMWQLFFKSAPSTLKGLEHGLKVDERVLRHIILRRKVFDPVLNTYKVSKAAAQLIHDRQQKRLKEARSAGQPLWWDPERPELAEEIKMAADQAMQECASPIAAGQDPSEGEEPGSGNEGEVATELLASDAGAFPNPPQVEQEAAEAADANQTEPPQAKQTAPTEPSLTNR